MNDTKGEQRAFGALRLFIAWIIGSAVYFLTLVFAAYDGTSTLVSGPIIGMVFSAVAVALCAGLGLLLRFSSVRRVWFSPHVSPGLCLLGVALLIYSVAHTTVEITDEGEAIPRLDRLFLPAYLLLLFAISNWPFFHVSQSA